MESAHFVCGHEVPDPLVLHELRGPRVGSQQTGRVRHRPLALITSRPWFLREESIVPRSSSTTCCRFLVGARSSFNWVRRWQAQRERDGRLLRWCVACSAARDRCRRRINACPSSSEDPLHLPPVAEPRGLSLCDLGLCGSGFVAQDIDGEAAHPDPRSGGLHAPICFSLFLLGLDRQDARYPSMRGPKPRALREACTGLARPRMLPPTLVALRLSVRHES